MEKEHPSPITFNRIIVEAHSEKKSNCTKRQNESGRGEEYPPKRTKTIPLV